MKTNKKNVHKRYFGVQNLTINKILLLIDEEIKENKKYFDEKEICWLCYEDNMCIHKEKIKVLEDLKIKINKNI